jgi:starch phosphorylase
MKLADLHALARDLWWTTDTEAHHLWARIDETAWKNCGHNPVLLLRNVDLETLDTNLQDDLAALIARWPRGTRKTPAPSSKRIAYFCMEFGLHEGLNIYSGGLGMLAGDHLRSASDLGLDMVAVGLFYRQGYFRQTIEDGRQVVHYPVQEASDLPISPVRGRDGTPIRVRIPNGEEEYEATAWEARVGHIRLFLLDTNLPENPEHIRELTSRLYGGDKDMRLRQEVLLGFGGKNLLDALSIQRDIFHMNEGHVAFLVTALVTASVALGVSVGEAWEHAKSRCVFTTHTPVPAGHDRFDADQVHAILGPTCEAAGLSIEDWAGPATIEGNQFCMSTLALKGSRTVNGVSKLHAEVSQEMFDHLRVHIRPITNGVHQTAWMASETASLFDDKLPGWRDNISNIEFWKQTNQLTTAELMTLRHTLRRRLIEKIRTQLGQPNILDENLLTIGFARRFATYKRADLIFTQPDRLASILDQGVQLVFAGKAHPKDTEGQALIETVIRWSHDPRFEGRVVFVPGYDPDWGRMFTQGSDVWLNNPRRPREASGTSGQKATLNGNPNLSVLDGWWPEIADDNNGWSIQGTTDVQDALELYSLLENSVLPRFNDPEAWASMMRHVISTCLPRFNTERMVLDYCDQLYDGQP